MGPTTNIVALTLVAILGNKCKRYNIGGRAHYTSRHKDRKPKSASNDKSSDASATASLAAIDDQPAMMRCEVPDYDTPVLAQSYNGYADVDDASVDSCLNAFLAAGSVASYADPPATVTPVVTHGLTLNFCRGQEL